MMETDFTAMALGREGTQGIAIEVLLSLQHDYPAVIPENYLPADYAAEQIVPEQKIHPAEYKSYRRTGFCV